MDPKELIILLVVECLIDQHIYISILISNEIKIIDDQQEDPLIN